MEDKMKLFNIIAKDDSLSLKDRGIFLVIFYLIEEDKEVGVNELYSILSEGKFSVINSLKSLKEKGYLVTTRGFGRLDYKINYDVINTKR